MRQKQQYIVRNSALRYNDYHFKCKDFFRLMIIYFTNYSKTNILSIKPVKRLKYMDFAPYAEGSKVWEARHKGFSIITILTEDEKLLNQKIEKLWNGKYCGGQVIFRVR